MSDILIKNGWIFNGRPDNILEQADLLIHFGKIETIGKVTQSRFGTKIINADGKIISPGFIDLNSQLDISYTDGNSLDDSFLIKQGITTAVIGGNGQSVFKSFLPKIHQNTSLETERGGGNLREQFLMTYTRSPLNVNLSSFLGWETARRWGISTPLQLSLFLDQTKACLAGVSLEFAKEKGEEILKQINELVPALSKRGKNLMIFFSDSVPDELLIKKLGQLSLDNQITIAINCLLLGCRAKKEILLETVKEQNKKGSKIIFKLWPYDLIPWDIFKVKKALKEKPLSIKNLAKIVQESILIGSPVPQFLRGKTIEEMSNNWGVNTLEALERIIHLLPESDISILIPYKLGDDWWDSSAGYVSVDSAFASEGNVYGPNVFSGFNHLLENRVAHAAADSWPQTLAQITSQPALLAGFSDRGFLQKDYLADIVIINPDKLKGGGSYQNPLNYGEGIETVIVGGQLVWQKGRVWKKGVGKLLI